MPNISRPLSYNSLKAIWLLNDLFLVQNHIMKVQVLLCPENEPGLYDLCYPLWLFSKMLYIEVAVSRLVES